MQKEIHGNRIGLFPVDPYAEEQLDTLPLEKDFNVSIANARKRGKLNFYWAGMGVLVDNFDKADKLRWPTTRHLHDTMMVTLGHVHRQYRLDHRSPDGVGWTEVADSIALDNMEEEEFEQVFETIRGAIVGRWGYDPWDAWTEAHPFKEKK